MLKGIYTFIRSEAEYVDGEWVPGKVKEIIEEENSIQYRYLEKIMQNQNWMGTNTTDGSTNASRVYISEIPQTGALYANVGSTSQWINGSIVEAAFYTPSDINAPTNGFWTIRTRFIPPAQTRYIRSVATAAGSQTSGGSLSAITLTTPCIQETTDILDVIFRIFVDWQTALASDNTTILDAVINAFELVIGNNTTSTQPVNRYVYYPDDISIEQISFDKSGIKVLAKPNWYATSIPISTRITSESSLVDAVFGSRVTFPLPGSNIQDYHGILIRSFSISHNTYRKLSLFPADKGVNSSVQNTYTRQADNGSLRLPFIDIDNLATSAASVIVTDPGAWATTVNEPVAHHYRIEITTGGLVGTAQYRIRRRRGTGWHRASYLHTPTVLSTTNPGNVQRDCRDGSDPVRHGQVSLHSTEYNTIAGQRMGREYVWPEYMTIGPAGLTIMHVNGDFENIDANSTIPLPATSILQVAVERELVTFERTTNLFVACENTGLWKITRPSGGPVSAIAQITPAGITNPDSCRGVYVNEANGEVWALFHDETDAILYLGKSADQGVTWTLYNEGTSPQFLLTDYTSGVPGPWHVIGLHVSHANGNNEIFIQAPDTLNSDTTGELGFWWSEAGSSPTSDQVRYNYTGGYANGLKFKLTGTKTIRPMDTGEWVIAAYAGIAWTNGNNVGSYLTTFGNAGIIDSSTNQNSPGSSSIGQTGPIIIKGPSGEDLLVGAVGATSFSPANTYAGRTAAQYDTLNYTMLLHENTGSVTTTSSTARNYPLRPEGSSGSTTTGVFYSILEHIGKGMFLCKQRSLNQALSSQFFLMTFYGDGRVATEHALPWFESYGWNGASWEVDEVGNRLTHATDETMLDTLQIRFDDDGGTNPLVVGEYYDVYVYDGILLDDATSFTQTMYNYMQATTTGTDFTPATVPASDIGAVVSEPIALSFNGTLAAKEGITSPEMWGLPGKIIAGGGLPGGTPSDTGYLEHRLVGDFEFRFKQVDSFTNGVRIGLTDWSNIEAFGTSLLASTALHFNIEYDRTAVNNPAGTIDYNIRVNTVALNSTTTAASIVVNGGAESDVFAFRRVGTTLTFLVNGVVEYTFPSPVAADLGVVMGAYYTSAGGGTPSGGWTIYDGEIDYTINRRYVELGNGVNTGASDVNLYKVATERVGATELTIQLNGTPATVITDGITAPAPGEVTVLPYSGRLWFNDADAGATITGNWRIIKKLNLE